MTVTLCFPGDVMADIFRFVYSKVCCCGCCRRKDRNKVESLKSEGVRTHTPISNKIASDSGPLARRDRGLFGV